MRLSTLILPVYPWAEGRHVWRRAEDLGFHAAYTYDHLTWRAPFADGPWFGAVPTLTAAAAVTERLRLGTMVTSPNFRHPVTLAKDLMTLDDLSGGRVTAGIGAGSAGVDASALGHEPWPVRERTARFDEFVTLLDRLLREDVTTFRGRFYAAQEARNLPGCVQRPRLPFAIAANGPRGMRLAAEHGQSWVTTGDSKRAQGLGSRECLALVQAQTEQLDDICAQTRRDPRTLSRVLLTGFTPDASHESVASFVDFAGRYAERCGIDEIVLHWPVPDSIFAADMTVFERIATEGLAQLARQPV